MPRKKQPRERGYGEGSLRFNEDKDSWEGRFRITDEHGKTRTRYFESKDWQKVEAQLDALVEARRQGLTITPKRMTITQLLAAFVDDAEQRDLAPKTLRDYRDTAEKYIVPHVGAIELDKLTAREVTRLMADVRKTVSPSMAMRCRRILRAALNRAVKWGYLTRNAAALTDPVKLPQKEMLALNPDQARTFFDAVAGDRLEALYTLTLALGLRQGEVLGLRWQDIDLEGGTLSVRHQLQRVNGALVLREPKAHSQRTLTLPPVVVDCLRQHQLRQMEERAWEGTRWQDTGFVFTSSIGTPLDADNVRKLFKEIVKATDGIPPALRFHDLRHTAASLLNDCGANDFDVSRTLGHSQVSTTRDIYTHLFEKRRDDIATMMNDVLTAPRKKNVG